MKAANSVILLFETCVWYKIKVQVDVKLDATLVELGATHAVYCLICFMLAALSALQARSSI